MPGSVIVSSARTPIGKLSGALVVAERHRPRRPRDQGRARAGGVSAEQVDYVLMGQVIQAGSGRCRRGRPRSRAASR